MVYGVKSYARLKRMGESVPILARKVRNGMFKWLLAGLLKWQEMLGVESYSLGVLDR